MIQRVGGNHPKVLVTGASGFIGRALVAGLIKSGIGVKACIRNEQTKSLWPSQVETVCVPDIDRHTDWTSPLQDVTCVVHLAGRAHVIPNDPSACRGLYEEINYRATDTLMRACQRENIGRLVFLSSVKVHGEGCDRAYREDDRLVPQDAYAQSKRRAEEAIQTIGAKGATEWVILRSPLVYGPGVKANFLRLLKLVDRNLPLPMAVLSNRRSLIYVENLVDAIINCIDNPKAAGHIFLVSDDFDLTVTELLEEIARAMGRNPKLFPLPPPFIEGLCRIVGKGEIAAKMTRPLIVDISWIKDRLEWLPPISVRAGIAATVNWFQNEIFTIRSN